MLTKDKYQEAKEEEIQKLIDNLLEEAFKNPNKEMFVVSDDYYDDKENAPYQLCMKAQQYGILEPACQKYNVGCEFQNYPYDRGSQKFQRAMFIFKRKPKGLVRTNPLYPIYPHK